MSGSAPTRPVPSLLQSPTTTATDSNTAAPVTVVDIDSASSEPQRDQLISEVVARAATRAARVRASVGPATRNGTDIHRRGRKQDDVLSDDTKPPIPLSEQLGSEPGATEPAGTRPTSKSSEKRSNVLNKRWRTPRNAKEFAAQANEVATMILNDEIDLNTARTFSGVSRTMAQILTAEVYRARYLHREPNLSLEWDDE